MLVAVEPQPGRDNGHWVAFAKQPQRLGMPRGVKITAARSVACSKSARVACTSAKALRQKRCRARRWTRGRLTNGEPRRR